MKTIIKLITVLLISLFFIKCENKKNDSNNRKEDGLSTINKDSVTQGKKYIKGCYPVWKHTEYPIDSVPLDRITHLTLCFAWPNADGTLNTLDIKDIDNIVSKCHQNNVKAILNIGGAGSPSDNLPVISIDSVLRERFVSNLTKYVIDHKVDGVEIDWECWPTPEKVDTTVSKAIVSLFRDLRSALPNEMALSYDVYSGDWYGKHYPTELINYVDEIVIMAFTATGPWSESGHHSPTSLVEESYNYWIGRIGKENKDKIVFSTPFFGFNFMPNHKEGSDSTAFGIGYNEILRTHPEAYLNDTVQTDTSVIYHNGIRTYKEKIDFIKNHDLKGISIWELSYDNVPEDKSLLKYINEEVNR